MTAAGAAGLALARPGAASAAWPATGVMAIDPAIEQDLRVVCCHDPLMIASQTGGSGNSDWSFAGQNAAVDEAAIMNNMDQMAMRLALQPTADAAWRMIFQKPAASHGRRRMLR